MLPAVPITAVRDVELYWERHGEGAPVLMISGTGNDLRTSFPDRHPYNRRFDVLHYDQRGLGRSSLGDHDPDMADFADDAAALVAATDWERCHVVGTSFGGMVAQHLAIRHPELIDRMVLNCTSPGGSLASFPLHELEHLPPEEAMERRLRVFDTRYDPAADDPIPGFGPFLDQYRRAATAVLPQDRRLGLHRQLMARARHDVLDDLGRITAPTLVCAGRYDAIAPLANSEAIAERIPGAQLEVFEGGHGFMLQDRRAHPAGMDFLAHVS